VALGSLASKDRLVEDSASRAVMDSMAPMAAWHDDPLLAQRFHPDFPPDDLQVIVHDGGPRCAHTKPELVWARVTAAHADHYEAECLNQPESVRSVTLGQTLLFRVSAHGEFPFQVSRRYLEERDAWRIKGCAGCGFDELFNAPSELIQATFPDSSDELLAFTARCPFCGDGQLVESAAQAESTLPGLPGERAELRILGVLLLVLAGILGVLSLVATPPSPHTLPTMRAVAVALVGAGAGLIYAGRRDR
jgi:hypothetical protein